MNSSICFRGSHMTFGAGQKTFWGGKQSFGEVQMTLGGGATNYFRKSIPSIERKGGSMEPICPICRSMKRHTAKIVNRSARVKSCLQSFWEEPWPRCSLNPPLKRRGGYHRGGEVHSSFFTRCRAMAKRKLTRFHPN